MFTQARKVLIAFFVIVICFSSVCIAGTVTVEVTAYGSECCGGYLLESRGKSQAEREARFAVKSKCAEIGGWADIQDIKVDCGPVEEETRSDKPMSYKITCRATAVALCTNLPMCNIQ